MPGQRNRGSKAKTFVPRPAQPYEAGNLAAVSHGARSRLIGPAVDALVSEIVEAVPVLSGARYRRAVEAWATAEARCDRLREYVAGLPPEELSADRGPSAYELQSERLAAKLRAELALSLASHAMIARTDFGKTADSTAARSMMTKLYADLQSVVAEGRAEEVVAAAAERGELERKAEEAGR